MRKISIVTLIMLSLTSFQRDSEKVLWSKSYDFSKLKIKKLKNYNISTTPFMYYQGYSIIDSNTMAYKCDCYIRTNYVSNYPSHSTKMDYIKYLQAASDICELTIRENKKYIKGNIKNLIIDKTNINEVYKYLDVTAKKREFKYEKYISVDKDSLNTALLKELINTIEFDHDNCSEIILKLH